MSSQQLPEVPNISVLSPLVTRILGYNSSPYTLQGTNTYLIGTGKQRILIDAGEGKNEYTHLIAQYVELLGIEISAVLLTHRHEDHMNGVQPILQHPSLGPKINRQEIYKHCTSTGGDSADNYPWPVQNISNGQTFKGNGFTLTGYHTPGHSDDHFIFWLEEEQALFSGDNVLGHGTTTFENLSDYMKSLKFMLRIVDSQKSSCAIRTYPGHGQYIADSHTKVSEYIHHRTERENEIFGILYDLCRDKGVNASLTTHSLTRIIYKDYPAAVWSAAEQGIGLHLEKLLAENRVQKINSHWKVSLFARNEAKL